MMNPLPLALLLLTGFTGHVLAEQQPTQSSEQPSPSKQELLIRGCFNDGYQGRSTLKLDQYIGNDLFIDNFRAYETRYQRFLANANDPFRPQVRANLLDQPQHYAACADAQYQGYKTRMVEIWSHFEARLEKEVQGRAEFQRKVNCTKS